MRSVILVLGLAVLAGCSGAQTDGKASGGLSRVIRVGTAPYALLDLQTRTISYRNGLSDVATNPAYKDSVMVFHRVGPVGATFFVGVFEVTQAQWGRMDSSAPWLEVPDGTDQSGSGGVDWSATPVVVAHAAQTPDRPAYGLDYDLLQAVVTGFALPGSSHLAIPSGTQWQQAAGAGSGWAWGQVADRAKLAQQALVRETAITSANSPARIGAGGIDIGGPDPVGARSAGSTGIYDIHGNVWEWTSPGTEIRGGSWYDAASMSRVEVRAGSGQGLSSDVPHALIGARLVLVP